MHKSGHVDDEGEGGAATFGSKGPEAKVEILEWRAVDSITKEIEKGTNRYIVKLFPDRDMIQTDVWLKRGRVRCVLRGATGVLRW